MHIPSTALQSMFIKSLLGNREDNNIKLFVKIQATRNNVSVTKFALNNGKNYDITACANISTPENEEKDHLKALFYSNNASTDLLFCIQFIRTDDSAPKCTAYWN